MTELQIARWKPATPTPPWQFAVLSAALKAPSAVRQALTAPILRLRPGSRVRSRLLGIGLDLGWHLLNSGRHRELLKMYDPEIEIVWTGERKPLDMPGRFIGHAGALDCFGWMHDLATSGINAEILPSEILDGGGPCMAARLQFLGKSDRSAVVLEERVSTVYTLHRGRIAHQVILWQHEVDLSAELTAALDSASG